jgi:SPP1 gp7 family putative phage head morphogenesis protein
MYNSVSIERRYANGLQEMVLRMVKETRKVIDKLYRSDASEEYFAQDANIASQARISLNLLSDSMATLFADHGKIMAERMLDQTDEHVKSQMMASLKKLSGGLTIKQAAMPDGLAEVFTAAITGNVSLIKSIQGKFFEQIEGDIMRSIMSPAFGGHEQLIKNLQKYGDVSYKRARLIALDQSRKASQSTGITRMKAAGVTQGIWIHTAGTKEPRKRHKDFNGKMFELAKGAPVGDNDGDYVQPGDCINCRCVFQPVLNFGDDDD